VTRGGRIIALGFTLAAALAALMIAKTRHPREPRRPNVVMVLLDAARADRFSVYGYNRDTTPFMSTLAARGTRFDAAHSQGLWTRTSVPSVLTSTRVSEHGNVSAGSNTIDRLPSCTPDLVELFRDAGYETAGFTGPLFPGSFYAAYGWDRGFRWLQPDWFNRDPLNTATTPQFLRRIDVKMVDAFRDWLETRPSRPFFAYLHLMSPHGPFETPPEYLHRYIDRDRATAFLTQFAHSYKWDPARGEQHPDEVAYIHAAYDAAVRFSDDNVRQIVDALARANVGDNTVIVVFADHGENLLEHGVTSWLHAPSQPPFEALTHIPLIVAGPGIPLGIRSDLVTQLDIAPTLLRLAHITVPSSMRGRDLFDSAAPGTPPATITEGDFEYRAKTIESDRWKYVRVYADKNTAWYARAGLYGETLFDLRADPGETRDVSFNHPDIVRRLRAALDEQLRGSTGWHVAVRGSGQPADYRLTVQASKASRRASLRYEGDSPIDLQVALASNLLSGGGTTISVPAGGLERRTFDAPIRLKAGVYVMGAEAQVPASDGHAAIALEGGDPQPMQAVTGKQPEWTLMWRYVHLRQPLNGPARINVTAAGGGAAAQVRNVFLSPALDAIAAEAAQPAEGTPLDVPFRLASGTMVADFEFPESVDSISVEVRRDGQLVTPSRVFVAQTSQHANPVKIDLPSAFVQSRASAGFEPPVGSVLIYRSGVCGGMTSREITEQEQRDLRERLRALGYIQ
jgi:arylsulfatase